LSNRTDDAELSIEDALAVNQMTELSDSINHSGTAESELAKAKKSNSFPDQSLDVSGGSLQDAFKKFRVRRLQRKVRASSVCRMLLQAFMQLAELGFCDALCCSKSFLGQKQCLACHAQTLRAKLSCVHVSWSWPAAS
jgi:hypothetical protein